MVDTVYWQILLVALAGWVNRHQLEVIAYLREENRVLREQLGNRRLRLTNCTCGHSWWSAIIPFWPIFRS
jgi:hypothetical protein